MNTIGLTAMINTNEEALKKLNQLKLRQLTRQGICETFPFVKDGWILMYESLDSAKWECFLSEDKNLKLSLEMKKPDGEFLGYNLNCELSSSLECLGEFVILSYINTYKITSYYETRFYICQCLERGEHKVSEIKNIISKHHNKILDKY